MYTYNLRKEKIQISVGKKIKFLRDEKKFLEKKFLKENFKLREKFQILRKKSNF